MVKTTARTVSATRSLHNVSVTFTRPVSGSAASSTAASLAGGVISNRLSTRNPNATTIASTVLGRDQRLATSTAGASFSEKVATADDAAAAQRLTTILVSVLVSVVALILLIVVVVLLKKYRCCCGPDRQGHRKLRQSLTKQHPDGDNATQATVLFVPAASDGVYGVGLDRAAHQMPHAPARALLAMDNLEYMQTGRLLSLDDTETDDIVSSSPVPPTVDMCVKPYACTSLLTGQPAASTQAPSDGKTEDSETPYYSVPPLTDGDSDADGSYSTPANEASSAPAAQDGEHVYARPADDHTSIASS